MKIAMMVRGYIPVPRPADIIYAPIDLAVDIAKGLSAKGAVRIDYEIRDLHEIYDIVKPSMK